MQQGMTKWRTRLSSTCDSLGLIVHIFTNEQGMNVIINTGYTRFFFLLIKKWTVQFRCFLTFLLGKQHSLVIQPSSYEITFSNQMLLLIIFVTLGKVVPSLILTFFNCNELKKIIVRGFNGMSHVCKGSNEGTINSAISNTSCHWLSTYPLLVELCLPERHVAVLYT